MAEEREVTEATSPKKRLKDVIDDFDESYDLDELFQTVVDQYQDVLMTQPNSSQ